MNAIFRFGDGLFGWVLQTTWQATILAVLIILAQTLLRHRLSAGWRYGLWLLLVVRLVLPAAPQTAWSIFNIAKPPLPLARVENVALPRTSPANPVPPMPGASAEARPAVQSPSAVSGTAATPGQVQAAALAGTARENLARVPILDWHRAALLVWLLGSCIFAARLLWSNLRFGLRIAAEPPVTNEPARRQFDHCRWELGIRQVVDLIETEAVESPSVHGLWRKRLLLPKGTFDRFSVEQLRCIFLHELAHIKRRDLEVNWLASSLQALHWFNPLLWFGFSRMRADREMACDALALAHLGKAPSKSYGETIIKVVENLVRPPRARGLLALSEDKRQLEERMRMIAAFRGRPGLSVRALSLVAVIAVVGLTDAQPGGTSFVQLSPATAPATTAAEVVPPATADLSQKILGAWELVSTKTPPATQFTDYPKEHRRVKLITPYRFLWVGYDTATGKIEAEAGGPYTVTGDVNTETIEFASDEMAQRRGSQSKSKIRVVGDWYYQSGGLDDTKTEETWQRIAATPNAEQDQVRKELLGAWEMVALRPWNTTIYFNAASGRHHVKFFTMTYSAWVDYDQAGKVITMGSGGPYTVQDEFYIETLQFASGSMTRFLGGRPKFKLRVEGDIYYQLALGEINNDEIWQRISSPALRQ